MITAKSDKKQKLSVNFEPSLNGQYKIAFADENLDDGFAVLLKGGLFHRFPDGFVVTKKHLELLDTESVDYKKIKRPK